MSTNPDTFLTGSINIALSGTFYNWSTITSTYRSPYNAALLSALSSAVTTTNLSTCLDTNITTIVPKIPFTNYAAKSATILTSFVPTQ